MNISVRNIDPEIWRALRAEAVRRGISVAALIEELWLHYPLMQQAQRNSHTQEKSHAGIG